MDEYAIKLLEEIAYRIAPRTVEKDEFLAQFKAKPYPEAFNPEMDHPAIAASQTKRKPVRK